MPACPQCESRSFGALTSQGDEVELACCRRLISRELYEAAWRKASAAMNEVVDQRRDDALTPERIYEALVSPAGTRAVAEAINRHHGLGSASVPPSIVRAALEELFATRRPRKHD